MEFLVITKVPAEGSRGNLALCMPWRVDPRVDSFDVPAERVVDLTLNTEVFCLGEILVVDSGGREVCGRGRKPAKWDVETESFDTVDDAITRAKEVS